MKHTFNGKIYAVLFVGFLLLILSFIISYNNINHNSRMLKRIDNDQTKLNFYVYQLNNSIKQNHEYVLKTFLLQEKISSLNKLKYLKDMSKYISKLKEYNDNHANLDVKFSQHLNKIRKRLVSYKIVLNSLIDKMKLKDKTSFKNAIMRFNDIVMTMSKDIELLTTLANQNLYKDITMLEQNNKSNARSILFTSLIAMLMIIFSIYKFNFLHKNLSKQLLHSEKAEKNLKEAQKQLLHYNDNLESEINKKTQELHLKIYNHFISGLPNRNRLLEDVTTHNFVYMALLNIDKFQSFNDVYGEEVGNIALKLTADFLREQIENPELYLYHIGGDEFAVVCRNSKFISQNNFIKKIESILKHYEAKTFFYDDKKFSFMMSAGITFNGKQKKMLAYADMALKDAKKRNIQLSLFHNDKKLEKVHQDDIECHKKLLLAIQKDMVVSHFQPICSIQDKTKPTKYESLVRIIDNEKIILPFNFIDIAKANRIYYKITKAVIKNTFDVISKYKVPCSMNLSLADIDNERTMEHFFDALRNFKYSELLTIELLETEDFKNYENVYNFCIKVRTFGIKVALDDFGAGYSNFSHILHLPVDYIKIDASLISNIDKDYNSKIMVETIVSLAKKLNVETIAEFVSSKEILKVITEIGVDYAQGFHLGRPEPIQNHIEV